MTAGALLTVFTGSVLPASAQGFREGWVSGTASSVGPVTAAITGLNYDESGTGVNGFLVGNVLLTFSRPVCGGIGSLGVTGNSVTYSGTAVTLSSGFQVVHVTSFTNGTITYPPAAPPKPTAYAATPGTITQLNYNLENGSVNGFVFTPTSGPKVFVGISRPNSTLAPLLTVGASVSVTGTLEAPPLCTSSGTISEVDASSLTIGSNTYPMNGWIR